MAEKQLVYRISFEGLDAQAAAIGKVDSELSALNKSVKEQRNELADLTSKNKQGTAAYEQLSNELGKNIVQQKSLSKAKSDLIRETQNEAKSNQLAEGSINQLRAQLSLATKDYNALSKAERDSAKGTELQKKVRETSDALKALESAVGDNRRNVGNYRDALNGLQLELKNLIAVQNDLAKNGAANTAAFNANALAIGDLVNEYKDLQQQQQSEDNQLKDLLASQTELANSTESLKSKLRELKDAAALAGEGTEDFKRLTAEAAALQDQIDDANDAINQEKGTEFEKFSAQLGGVGESLLKLDFKQANDRIANLGQTLKGFNFTALKDGLKGLGSSFSALGKTLLANPIFLIAAIVAAVGIALFALKDKVKIIGDAFELLFLPIEIIIQGFKDLSDSFGLSAFAAEEAAAKTAAAYKGSLENLVKFTDNEVRELERQIKIRKASGDSVEQLELKKLQVLQDSLRTQIKLKAGELKNLALTDEAYKETAKSLDELRQAYLDVDSEITAFNNAQVKSAADANKVAQANFVTAGSIKALQNQISDLQKRQSNLNVSTDKGIFAYSKLEQEIINLNRQISEIKRLGNPLSEINYEAPIANIKLVSKELETLQSQVNKLVKIEQPKLFTEPFSENKSAEERAAEIQANATKFQEIARVTQDGLNTIAQINQAASQERLDAIENERLTQIAGVEQLQLSEEQKAIKLAEINKTLDAKALVERKKAAKEQLSFTLAQIALNTATSISAGIAGATTSGAATGAAAFVATPLFIATTIATILGAMAQATAAVKASKKFEDGGELPKGGGFIKGRSHAQGGVKFDVGGRVMEAEGGEIIVNKNIQSRPDFVQQISKMNAATGGVDFFAAGGVVAPKFNPQGANITSSPQGATVSEVATLLSSTLNSIQVVNNVTDTSSNQSMLIQIQNQTTI